LSRTGERAVDIEGLKAIQDALRVRVVLEDGFRDISLIGGADVSYSGEGACCTVAVLDVESLELVEEQTLRHEVSFPYVPGYLSFREAGPVIKTFRALKERPDVLLIDGHGIAHPRGIGLASHVGVILNQPTIGVAKRPLVGDFTAPEKVGDTSEVVYGDRVVGYAYLSWKNTRSLIVSPGHRISLESSLRVVKRCIKGHKLPEPLRLAHNLSKTAISKQGSSRSSQG